MDKFTQLIKLRKEILASQMPKKKNEMEEGGLENACWEGYEPIGTKMLDGKEVPNCVPIKDGMSKIKKEGFPIPSPEGDDEEKYISKCISEISGEYNEEGQAYAICKGKWDDK
jgi:hypothetical protein